MHFEPQIARRLLMLTQQGLVRAKAEPLSVSQGGGSARIFGGGAAAETQLTFDGSRILLDDQVNPPVAVTEASEPQLLRMMCCLDGLTKRLPLALVTAPPKVGMKGEATLTATADVTTP